MMWSGITSYLFSYESKETEVEDVVYCTREGEDEWLFVDVAGSEQENQKPKEESLEFLPDIILKTSANKQEPVRPTTPSSLDESWYITPPPCFTADAPVPLETSPMENLLIEHPSMSVYGSKPPSILEKFFSKKGIKPKKNTCLISNEEEKHESHCEMCKLVQMPKQEISQNRNCRVPYRLSAALKRADVIDNIENLNPGQQAKWQQEQKQFQRSFLNRLNRVHHYQSSTKHPRRKDCRLRPSGINNNRNC